MIYIYFNGEYKFRDQMHEIKPQSDSIGINK
jgi:hypothetical protein